MKLNNVFAFNQLELKDLINVIYFSNFLYMKTHSKLGLNIWIMKPKL